MISTHTHSIAQDIALRTAEVTSAQDVAIDRLARVLEADGPTPLDDHEPERWDGLA